MGCAFGLGLRKVIGGVLGEGIGRVFVISWGLVGSEWMGDFCWLGWLVWFGLVDE